MRLTTSQHNSTEEELVDARGLVRELVGFLAREKRMSHETPRAERIEAKRRLLAKQARELGVKDG